MLVCCRCPSAGLRMHNRCCASAYQLLCKRTTAVVQPTELTSPITYTIFSDNFICLFRQLLPYSEIVSYTLSFDIIRLRVFNNAIILIIRWKSKEIPAFFVDLPENIWYFENFCVILHEISVSWDRIESDIGYIW